VASTVIESAAIMPVFINVLEIFVFNFFIIRIFCSFSEPFNAVLTSILSISYLKHKKVWQWCMYLTGPIISDDFVIPTKGDF
jgi:hypothetical protein